MIVCRNLIGNMFFSRNVMGNQLSTWNTTIQSAVYGENFNYNPDYNQVCCRFKEDIYNLNFDQNIHICQIFERDKLQYRLHFLGVSYECYVSLQIRLQG